MNRRPAGPGHIGLKHLTKVKRNCWYLYHNIISHFKGPGSGRDPEGEGNASKISL